MNINDSSVLDKLNNLIITERLNKTQILAMVKLVSVSNNIRELKENIKWENSDIKY